MHMILKLFRRKTGGICNLRSRRRIEEVQQLLGFLEAQHTVLKKGDGTMVEVQDRGYNLHLGRCKKYRSPLVSRVSRSPAHDVE